MLFGFDRVRGEFTRAGSASAKLGNKDAKGIQCSRVNGNLKASTKHQSKILLCNSYPEMDAALIALYGKEILET